MQVTVASCSQLFEEWLKYKSIFVDRNTIDWYKGTLTSLKQTGFADKPVALKKLEAYEFVRDLKGKIHLETLKRKLENLEACWNWAIEHECVHSNPWKGLASQIKVPQSPPPQPFTSEEIAKIFEAFEASPRYKQLTPFVKFLFWTGTRTGEAIGLRWGDISPDLTKVTISTQFTRRQRKPAKRGKVRSFGLSQKTMALLAELKGDRTPKASEPVFTWNGRLIDIVNFRRRVWEPLLDSAGVSHRRVYMTRHTFISHCLERGMNPATIAAITGHDVAVLFAHYAGSLHAPQAPDL